MIGLITDRTQANVDRRKNLSAKGWNNMTAAEQAEWSGSPLLNEGANLIPKGENHSPGTTIKYRDDSIRVTAVWEGVYVYAIVRIGPAADYEGKTLTLSLDACYSNGGGKPNVVLYWHDANGAEYAGGGLTAAGSMTFTLTPNTGGRANLVVYLYATTDAAISPGAYITYERLMMEIGSTRHEYVPYYDVVPTLATKGAYNYSDLNRVEAVIAELADMSDISLQVKTDWSAWDIPKQGDMARILGNIRTLRGLFPLPSDAPEIPASMENLTYDTANDLEKVLEALAVAVDRAFRTGELYAGEN